MCARPNVVRHGGDCSPVLQPFCSSFQVLKRINAWFHTRVLSNTLSLSSSERWKASLGALLCLAACGLLLRSLPLDAHWLLAPVGASVVILFVQFHSPLAQPWPLLGSYLIATATGLACSHWVTQPILAAALAVALTIWLMAWLNCVHPPGGGAGVVAGAQRPVFQRRHGGGG